MASIKKYLKKDGSTAYMFNAYLGVNPLTGKSKRTTRRGFRTQKEAKLALAELQLSIESNNFVKQDYSRFKDVYALWYAQHINTIKASSAQRIRYYFEKQILPAFGELKIDKITSAYCQKTVNEWFSTYTSFTSLKSYTSKVFDFALNQQLLKENPMERIVMPKKQRQITNKSDQNFLDKIQLNQFLRTLQEHESMQTFTMFRVLAYTGLRKGELLALTWDDLDITNENLSINKNVSSLLEGKVISSTKTASSERTISIDQVTLGCLKKWKLQQKKMLLSRGIRVLPDETQLIFSNIKNQLLYHGKLRNIINKYSDFNITVHGFRHTHASLLFEAGATIKQVQTRLGHTNVQTTLNIYTHVTKDAEKDTATIFLKYMNS